MTLPPPGAPAVPAPAPSLRDRRAHDAYLLALSDALRPLSSALDIQATASRLLGEFIGADRVVYFEVQGGDYVVERDYTRGVASIAGRHPTASFGARMLATYLAGDTAIGRDVAHSDMSSAERAAHAALDIGAYVGVPLMRNGRFVVGIAAHTRGPRDWTEDEIALVAETAERTTAVLERARAEEALARSEAHFREMFDSIDQGMCTIEVLFDDAGKAVDYRFLDINAAFERQTGIEGGVGRRMREIAPGHEDFWFERYGHIATTGEAMRFEHQAEALGRYYEVFAFRIGAPQERRVAVLFGDLTARRRFEEELREADRRKDEFLATLAHELRNPLAPIRNSLQVLRHPNTDAAVAAKMHDMMERQVDHMVRLVDDLMEVSRITRGKFELRRAPTDVKEMMLAAVDTSRPLIEAAGHRLVIALPPEPLSLDADAVRIAQVLANLLNNAAKYTESGGEIHFSARREAESAAISVRDNGMGIAAELLPRVFDLFAQGDRTYERAQGGLGIGLTLVRSLIEMHGGTVEAASAGPGQGSEFIVRLPLAAGAAAAPAPAPEAPRSEIAARQRILAVDDNADAVESLCMLLAMLGAEVRSAADGKSALAAFEQFRPTVVVLDIGLPGMDGFEVARRLRLLPGGAHATLIALTGWGQEEDRRRAGEAGFDHHLVKPLEFGALKEILAGLKQG